MTRVERRLRRRLGRALIAYRALARDHVCYSVMANIESGLYGRTFIHAGGRCTHRDCNKRVSRILLQVPGWLPYGEEQDRWRAAYTVVSREECIEPTKEKEMR